MRSGTSLGRVRGLGSAREGAHHWWKHRLTAGSNLFLMVWLVVSIARQPSFDYVSMKMWLSNGWVALPMALLILSVFTHFRMGLQVVIEDYQHDEARVVSLVLLNAFTLGLGAIALFSILKIALGAAA